jgi:hypothetical protein
MSTDEAAAQPSSARPTGVGKVRNFPRNKHRSVFAIMSETKEKGNDRKLVPGTENPAPVSSALMMSWLKGNLGIRGVVSCRLNRCMEVV